MSSIYSIYSAYCVVTKQHYIGFDSKWPKRQQDHKRESQKNNNIKFYNLETGEIINCNRWIFYHNYKINKGGVSEMVNKGIIYKNWCVLFI